MKFFTTLCLAVLVLGCVGSDVALAAGPPAVDLFSTGNFTLLSETGITDANLSTVVGNVGAYPITGAALLLTCTEVTGTIFSSDVAGPLPCRVTDAALLNTAINDLVNTVYPDAAGRSALAGDTNLFAGNIGGQTFLPGLYAWTTNVSIPTSVTLSGGPNDVWIFQMTGDLNIASGPSVVAGTKVLLIGGARAENVFWQVGGGVGATIGTYATFEGNILSAKQVVLQSGAVLHGRALAQTLITLDANTISTRAKLHVIKNVVNVAGGTATSSDFTLHVTKLGVDVTGSPTLGTTTPGTLYTLDPGSYVVSEDPHALYTKSFSGDCAADGSVALAFGDEKTCTITNTDVSALLHVIKQVVDNGGVHAVPESFTLFVKSAGVDVTGSPALGTSTPGTRYVLAAGTYVVSEGVDTFHTKAFSGDCDAAGSVTLIAGADKTCIVTNTGIPPVVTSGGGGGGGGFGNQSTVPTITASPATSTAPIVIVATTTPVVIVVAPLTSSIVVTPAMPEVVLPPVVETALLEPRFPDTGLPPRDSAWSIANQVFVGIALFAALVVCTGTVFFHTE